MTSIRPSIMLLVGVLLMLPLPAGAQSGLDQRPSPGCTALDRPPGTSYQLARVFSDLSFNLPLALLQSPGDTSRWYLVEQAGRILTFLEGDTVTTVFADLSGRVSTTGNEQGLLGMAFHPDYPETGLVYLSYTALDGRTVISRFTLNSGGLSLNIASESILLEHPQPFANHNGGNIAFGPDGYLYISLGDGGSAGDPQNNAQDITTLLGAMLRIDVDGAFPYAIPSDNPFSNSADCSTGCPEIYAWGFRNPWRFSFDPGNGDLWVGDVGQNAWEEIDLVVAGRNYGWRCYEGNHEYDISLCDLQADYEFPVVEYPHANGDCSVTGGFVYRGAMTGLLGQYIFGDFCTGKVWRIINQGGVDTAELLVDSDLRLTSFGQGHDGEIYALDRVSGGIFQLQYLGPPPPDTFPATLSQTEYFNPLDPTLINDCFIPYDLNSPLWSDNATKRRWMSLPDNATIQIDADGDFLFPIGSVLVKEFSLNGQRIETRLFMRHADGGWAGYTYEWNATQTDASLLYTSKTRDIGGQTWLFPSRNQCQQCHTAAAGHTLGPEIGQLNRDFTYPSTGRTANQLTTLASIGMFDAALPNRLASYPEPGDTSKRVDLRAKSYLHANCANCHRPGGAPRGSLDLRYQTPLPGMGICGRLPELGDLGLPDPLLFAPGEPSRSILPLRMKDLGVNRMPPLASNVRDPLGTGLVDGWVQQTRSCVSIAPWQLLFLE